MKISVTNLKGKLLVEKIKPKNQSNIILSTKLEDTFYGKIIDKGILEQKIYSHYILFQYAVEVTLLDNKKYYIVNEKDVIAEIAFEGTELDGK